MQRSLKIPFFFLATSQSFPGERRHLLPDPVSSGACLDFLALRGLWAPSKQLAEAELSDLITSLPHSTISEMLKITAVMQMERWNCEGWISTMEHIS